MNDKPPPSLNRFAAELEQAIRRELGPRRDRGLSRVLRDRPRLLAGTTVGAIGTGVVLAIVLGAATSSPAFAVARNRDGSFSVTLRSLRAIPEANAKLARMGLPARLVPIRGACPAIARPAIAALPAAAQSVRVPARSLRHDKLLMIAAWRKARQVKVASALSRAAVACLPPCPGVIPGAKAVSVQAPIAAARLKLRTSPKSSNASPGKGGNGPILSPPPPPLKALRTQPIQLRCPAPPLSPRQLRLLRPPRLK